MQRKENLTAKMNRGFKICNLIPVNTCFYEVQLCVLFCLLVLLYYVMHIYANSETISHQHSLQSEIRCNDKDNIVFQATIKEHTSPMIKKVPAKAKQFVKLPNKSEDVDKNTNSSQKIINQHKIELPVKPDQFKQNQDIIINKDVDQQKVVKPTDGVKESKNDSSDSKKEHDNQKDNNQVEKADGKPDQVIQNQPCRDPVINATHVYGTLMEPVNVNYTRNIYFSVKTIYS